MAAPATALYTTAQVRELDRHAIDHLGIAGYTLMQRAAAALWDELARRWPQARCITVVCGPGNNGGDGYLLARLARGAGREVIAHALAGEPQGDAATARQAWLDAGGAVAASGPDALETADVIVDAMFGSGLNRALAGSAAAWVDAINAAGKPVLAVDVPSGLDADTGSCPGPCVRATATVTMVGWKRGLFTHQALDCCGVPSLATLDLPTSMYAAHSPDAELLPLQDRPARPRARHKGQFGHVLVIGGEHGFGGAACLAGEAALRCGAGLVSVATRERHVPALLARRPELMAQACEDGVLPAALLNAADVLVTGPGLGRADWGRRLLAQALASSRPLVLDADGLNLLATQPVDFVGRAVVLTPHPGEAARLLGCDTATVQADRFVAARRLAHRFGCVVILKGAGSLVAAPDGRVATCPWGNPGMATAGTGDVLAGMVAALLAQGLPAWQAACHATGWHARAGDIAASAGPGMLAGDLVAALRRLPQEGA